MTITFEKIKRIWHKVNRPQQDSVYFTYTSEKKKINGIPWHFVWVRATGVPETINFLMRDEKNPRITIEVTNDVWQEPQYAHTENEDSTNDEINLLNTIDQMNWTNEDLVPSNPVTDYDTIWNEDTQGWGLTNVSRHKIKTVIFHTWKELKQYLADNNQFINTYNQVYEQEKLSNPEEREVICPEGDKFISLRCRE